MLCITWRQKTESRRNTWLNKKRWSWVSHIQYTEEMITHGPEEYGNQVRGKRCNYSRKRSRPVTRQTEDPSLQVWNGPGHHLPKQHGDIWEREAFVVMDKKKAALALQTTHNFNNPGLSHSDFLTDCQLLPVPHGNVSIMHWNS